MANTGFKGVDVRQTGTALVFRALLQSSTGALVTSGTTNLYLMELQSDGTIKTYDFNDNTFKTTACTTETLAMTHRPSNNASTNTGLWTVALSTLTGFTAGAVYLARVNNTTASPPDQMREFQFGSEQGDVTVLASGSTGVGYVEGDIRTILGTASAGAAGYVGPDWGHVNAPTTTVALTNTTISSSQNVIAANSVFNNCNVTQWSGNAVAATSVNGVPKVDVQYVLGSLATVAPDPWSVSLPGSYASGTAGKILGSTLSAQVVSYAAGQDPATLVLDVAAASHNTAGTIGRDINSAGTASDPWTVALPGSYASGTAGYIIGHNIDALISSRSTYAGGAVASVTAAVTVGGYSAGQDPASIVLDVAASSHNTAGTIGAKINSAGTASDPWSVSLPGSYGAGSAGFIMGTNLNATVSSRSTYAGGAVASVSSPVTVGAYSTGQDPSSMVLDATASAHNITGTIGSKINASAAAGDPWSVSLPGSYGTGTAGKILGTNLDAPISQPVTLDLTQAVPTSNVAQTTGDALNAARAQGFGKWTLNATTKVYTLFAPDGVTVVKTLTYDSVTQPTVRQ